MPNQPHRLPLSTKILFAFGNVGLQMMVAATSFFLLIFYTDVALVPPALAGTALLVGTVCRIASRKFIRSETVMEDTPGSSQIFSSTPVSTRYLNGHRFTSWLKARTFDHDISRR